MRLLRSKAGDFLKTDAGPMGPSRRPSVKLTMPIKAHSMTDHAINAADARCVFFRRWQT
jgi:hypothetical protein